MVEDYFDELRSLVTEVKHSNVIPSARLERC